MNRQLKILSFGEVLWDCFGSDRLIGGAPFNFASHLIKNGGLSDIVTAVGQDELGEKTVCEIKKNGVGAKFVSRSPYETGICTVTLDNGVPSYELKMPVAYDDIVISDSMLLDLRRENYDYLYCGSLALRHKTSFDALKKLKDNLGCDLICDINVRSPFFSDEVIRYLVAEASILKVSRDELPVVASSVGCGAGFEEFSTAVFNSGKCGILLLTLDKDGAVCFEKDKPQIYSVSPRSGLISAVGAGDSFFAAFMSRYNLCGDIKKAIDFAVSVSDYVVTKTEAIPDYRVESDTIIPL